MSDYGPGSVARGLGVLAVAAASIAVARAWTRGEEPAAPEPTCPAPIEILDDGSEDPPRLGCATELAGCGPVAAGDRVRMPSCAVEPGGMSAAARLAVGLPIDLNRASAADLELLDGIGPATAAAIVADREASGPYPDLDALTRVRGVGPRTVERLRPSLVVTPGPDTAGASRAR